MSSHLLRERTIRLARRSSYLTCGTVTGMNRQSIALVVGLIAAAAPAYGQACPPAADAARGAGAMADVRYLADDALAGRLAGSAGERCAGDYIAGEFARARLRPAGENGTFFQSLSLASALNPHAPGAARRQTSGLRTARPTHRTHCRPRRCECLCRLV